MGADHLVGTRLVALGSRTIDYQTNNFSNFLQALSSDNDVRTHPDCSMTQTFFPLPQLLVILFRTEQASPKTMF